MLDFLSSTDMGKLVPPLEEEDGAGCEVSEWELRERPERRERQAERRGEAEALGAVDDMGDGEELPLILPTTSFMVSAGEGYGTVFFLFFPLLISLDTSTLSGRGKAARIIAVLVVVVICQTEGSRPVGSSETPWRNGSVSDSRPEGCVFKSRRGQFLALVLAFFWVLGWFFGFASISRVRFSCLAQ